jgi:hypothetical protein
MEERRRVQLDYARQPPVEKPVTRGMMLSVILFVIGAALCLALLIAMAQGR